MAQEYELKAFDAGNFTDTHGNAWCTGVFKGFGEPVTWVMKPETIPHIKEGESYYGEIKDWTSSKGKIMPRFYRAQKDDERSHSSKPKYDTDGQRQGMAIKCAADYVNHWADKKLTPQQYAEAVKPYAAVLYNMSLKEEAVEVREQPQTGYQKARTQADKLKPETSEEEFQSLLGTALAEEEPIDLSSIPF